MTMNITKTLMLAGFAAMSLGVGAAMANDGGGASSDYWAQQYRAAAAQNAVSEKAAPAQFGASDAQRPRVLDNTNLTGGGL